jgi:hypothetical protein
MSMVASHLIWLFRTRAIRKRAKAEDKTFDEYPEGVEWQSKGVDLEAKFMKLVRSSGKGVKLEEGLERSETDVHVESHTVEQGKGEREPRNTVPNGMV